MPRSIIIFSVAGTGVRLHWTFILFLSAVAIISLLVSGFLAALSLLALLTLVFGSVLLHEFGHITVARLLGIHTPEVILLPIGGLAKLERIPTNPQHELAISIAGPAVNFILFGGLVILLGGWPDWDAISRLGEGDIDLLQQLAVFNLVIGVFNLLPAFPMDGGRIFRALLAFVQPRQKATRIAVKVSQGISVLLVMLGVLGGNVVLAVIGIFIFLAASAEAQLDLLRFAIGGMPVSQVMVTGQPRLTVLDPILDAAEAILHTDHEEFPVFDGKGKLVGVLIREDLLATLKHSGSTATVGQAMRRDMPAVQTHFRAEKAAEMIEGGSAVVAVVDNGGRYLGLVSRRNLLDLVAIREALDQARKTPSWKLR